MTATSNDIENINLSEWKFKTNFGVFEKVVKEDFRQALIESFKRFPPYISMLSGEDRPPGSAFISLSALGVDVGDAPTWDFNILEVIENELGFLGHPDEAPSAKKFANLLRDIANRIDAKFLE